jgi:hypothetical protein
LETLLTKVEGGGGARRIRAKLCFRL